MSVIEADGQPLLQPALTGERTVRRSFRISGLLGRLFGYEREAEQERIARLTGVLQAAGVQIEILTPQQATEIKTPSIRATAEYGVDQLEASLAEFHSSNDVDASHQLDLIPDSGRPDLLQIWSNAALSSRQNRLKRTFLIRSSLRQTDADAKDRFAQFLQDQVGAENGWRPETYLGRDEVSKLGELQRYAIREGEFPVARAGGSISYSNKIIRRI